MTSMTTGVVTYDRCDRCNTPLPRQHNIQQPDSIQYDNALIVRLEGSYGMFVDDLFRAEELDQRNLHPRYDSLLCHECGHELAKFLGKDPSNWHTHNPDSGMHADHYRI